MKELKTKPVIYVALICLLIVNSEQIWHKLMKEHFVKAALEWIPLSLSFYGPSVWNVCSYSTSSLLSFPPPIGPLGFYPNQISIVKSSLTSDPRQKVAFSLHVSKAHAWKSATADSCGIVCPIYSTVNSAGPAAEYLLLFASITQPYSLVLNLGSCFP